MFGIYCIFALFKTNYRLKVSLSLDNFITAYFQMFFSRLIWKITHNKEIFCCFILKNWQFRRLTPSIVSHTLLKNNVRKIIHLQILGNRCTVWGNITDIPTVLNNEVPFFPISMTITSKRYFYCIITLDLKQKCFIL